MKICFHDNVLTVRGTSNTLWSYAHWSQKLYGIEPIILHNSNNTNNQQIAIEKFKQRFPVFSYTNPNQIDTVLKEQQCNVFFMVKGGKYDGIISNVCDNWVHAIAVCNKNDIHGQKYAMGSKWLSKITNYEIDYVPYMVDIPNIDADMRTELNIPKNAVVFGRNGGAETFDIDFAKTAVVNCLQNRKNAFFIFQGTNVFVHHERVIYLPPSTDLTLKIRFLNTLDFFLHCRYIGESFGLSIAEASMRNKPVITWGLSVERNHIESLNDKGIYYNNYEDLYNILLRIDPMPDKNWKCYEDCLPEPVMNKFKYIYQL